MFINRFYRIKNIEGVNEIVPHIELCFTDIHESFEQINNGEIHEFSVTVSNNGKEKTYSEEIWPDVTIVNYDEINEDQIAKKFTDEGIYISDLLADCLEIEENGDYELSFLLLVPSSVIVGDGEIQFIEEDMFYPVNWIECEYIPVKLKVAGVLKGNSFCKWSNNTMASIFISNETFMEYINEYNSTEVKTYYSDHDLGYYVEEYNEDHEIGNICYGYPWTPNAYKIKIDSLEYYSHVVDSVEKMGFTTLGLNEDIVNIDKLAYHTSDTLVIFAVSVTAILVVMYLILKYINLYKEQSFKRFFKELNYSRLKINLLMIEKYLLDTVMIMLISLILLYAFQKICIQIEYMIAPITTLSIWMVIGLSIIIEFIFPVVLGGVCHDRT